MWLLRHRIFVFSFLDEAMHLAAPVLPSEESKRRNVVIARYWAKGDSAALVSRKAFEALGRPSLATIPSRNATTASYNAMEQMSNAAGMMNGAGNTSATTMNGRFQGGVVLKRIETHNHQIHRYLPTANRAPTHK